MHSSSSRRAEEIRSIVEGLPRERFIPEEHRFLAGEDSAVAIGYGQTISQPSLVAWMTELLEVAPGDRVLEIGTGSGFQAAVLARLGAEVYSVEVVSELLERARAILDELELSAHLRVADGHAGWPEAAPFDGIILTCATPVIPMPLWDQLAVGGRLVAPVGDPSGLQSLVRWRKREDGMPSEESITTVRFVPMTGGE